MWICKSLRLPTFRTIYHQITCLETITKCTGLSIGYVTAMRRKWKGLQIEHYCKFIISCQPLQLQSGEHSYPNWWQKREVNFLLVSLLTREPLMIRHIHGVLALSEDILCADNVQKPWLCPIFKYCRGIYLKLISISLLYLIPNTYKVETIPSIKSKKGCFQKRFNVL